MHPTNNKTAVKDLKAYPCNGITTGPYNNLMKRFFTTLVAMCFLSVSTLMAQVVFTTNFETEEEFNSWVVVNANNDDKTWTFDAAGDPGRVFYSYSGSSAADDWLISPAITSTETGTLAINIIVKGSSYTEKLEVFYGSAQTAEAMTNRISDVMELNGDITSHLFLVNVTANEPIYLGLHACSDIDKWRLYICSVTAQFTTNPVDICATEFTAPASDFGLAQEGVTVKVKNNGNVDVESFDLSFAVNGETIATETINQTLAKGAEMEYTFNAKADLSTPRQKYELKAWTTHADDVNTTNDTCRTEVLHKAPASIPYTMGFEENEYTDGITLFNLNEDDGNWDIYTDPWWSLAHTGDYCLAYNYDSNNNGNDWAILEPIKIEEPGYYVLKFWYSGDDTHPEKLGVYYGNEGTPDAMTNKIVEYAPFARSAYEESINIFYLDKAQDIYIGFYAFSDKDENWLCVDDVTLEKISSETVDLTINGITNPSGYVHKGSKQSIEYAVRSLGITDATATVRVKIDDVVVNEEQTTIKAQEIKEFVLEDALSTVLPGKHVLVVEVTNSDDTAVENNTDTLSFVVMGTPTRSWDFEDGQLPAEFTFRSEDEGTVNPSAGDEFNEAGWGIFNIQEHPQFGEHMLAATSWLDGTDRADRWCVLPPFCPSGESYLTWDAASFNPAYLESYSIMISNNGDDSWYYFTEEEFIAESPSFKTRGVELSSYQGDTIYVAFRLRSKNCEHLILDNIGLYGGELSAAKNIEQSQANIVMTNSAIEVKGVEVTQLALYSVNGSQVASIASNSISTEGLAAGVYIVRATTPYKVITEKVVIK